MAPKDSSSGLFRQFRHTYNPPVSLELVDNTMNGRTKGEIEAAIRTAIIKFEQEFMGRGPDDVKAFIVRDLVLIRLKGVLTPAERQLAKTADGIDMVKRLRQNLIAQGRDKLCEQISDITGLKATALFTDIDAQIGERVIVFALERDLESSFR